MLQKTKILIAYTAFSFFISCNQAPEKKEVTNTEPEAKTEVNYTKLGLDYAMSTKAILGKNLMSTIQAEGTEKALTFCNQRAYPLTDSMATVLNAKIKRVSDQERNPQNVANETELEFITKGKESLASGNKISPQVQEIDGKMVGYYPIITNQMCLQCHGNTESQITTATLNKINELYPNDKATGYFENQLRGIWVIEMDIQ